ncbi:Mbov_0396 family ICE element transmembrane protein [Mesomycoplasma hyopneumoniae]|uniref:Transmembrane protein n=1 Tax=Mesomycoplasma hyopneumoniae TaxID=2099 RepID=A0ABD4SXF3_MESHO|nr:hypothetical protein [Mesomycoplasma hyopneumoniae]MCI8283355.1 hypothetical protein [Mesomycoplasma hyopneumoniae]MCI8298287.1 hypothetical protein [Mesomycoplasma hyopneumoniae]
MFFGLVNWIAYAVFAAGWGIFAWPFITILNIITELFGFISFDLLRNIFFGGTKEFSISQIPIAFWIMTGIALALILFLILQRLVRNFFSAGKKDYDASLKNVIIKTIASILSPVLFIIFLFFGLIIVSAIINMIKDSLGYHNSLVSSFVKGALPPEVKKTLTDSDLKSMASGGLMSYDIYYNIAWGDGVKIIFLIALSTLITAWLLGSTVISLVANIVQMFYQLILLPVFSVSQISDEGKLFKKYMQAFWGKFWVVIISQLAFSFFFIWAEFSVNQEWNIEIKSEYVNQWIFSFFFSFLMILGGGVAIKTIAEEFAGYFGGQGFVRSQQEWAHRTTKGIGIAAGAITGVGLVASKGFRRLKQLGGFHDAKREEISNAFKKGEITRTQKREMLEKLKDERDELGQTFRHGWNNTKSRNPIKKAWAGAKAYKAGKDLGVFEEAAYLGSKMIFRSNARGIERKEAKLSKNQQKIDKVQKAIDFENYKKEYNHPEFDQRKLDKAENKMAKLLRKEGRINKKIDEKKENLNESAENFLKRSADLHTTVQRTERHPYAPDKTKTHKLAEEYKNYPKAKQEQNWQKSQEKFWADLDKNQENNEKEDKDNNEKTSSK